MRPNWSSDARQMINHGPVEDRRDQRSGTRLKGHQLTAPAGENRYQRLLAICTHEGEEINAWMVEAGWAVDYGGYAAEGGPGAAQQGGIWRGTFENPGEWRKAHKSQASAVSHTMPSWLAKF